MTAEQFLCSLDESLLGWNKRRQAGVLSCRYMFNKTWPEAYKRLYTFIDAHVYRALNLTSDATEEKSVSSSADPTRKYILLYELARQVRDPVALRFELINVFLPSRDTTASLMSNVFFQLARHPSYWALLRQSAFSVEFNSTKLSSLSIATLTTLIPFRHVILETLRTLGPAGRVFRKARYDTTLPRGGGPGGNAPVFVPQGTTVCSLTYHIHHDQDIWGEDADIFRPERWVEGNKAASEFVPFLIGPRICPAQQQVLVQATYFLFRIVREFEWIENRDQVEEYIELQRMAIESRRGVMIALGSNLASHKGEKRAGMR